jgi:hypothetical protein
MKIEYDTPIQVSEAQYKYCMNNFSGIVAGRFDGQKYWLKVWMMQYASHVEQFLNETN